MKKKISIISASYNYASLIRDTIESVIAQTYTNWELIIVDDGSKDNSVEVIKAYCAKDSRIKLFQHENHENKGLIATILLGIEKSTSDWIAFLESDDIFEPNYLSEKVKSLYENPDVGFVFNDVEFFGDKDKISVYKNWYSKPRTEVLSKNTLSYLDFFSLNIIPTFSCVMVKKELLKMCEFYSPEPQSIDWLLWAQLFNKTKVIYIHKKLSRWRLHKNSYINTVKTCQSENKNRHTRFEVELLKHLTKKKISPLIWLYERINFCFIEKLLRPQVKLVSENIKKKLLGKKYFTIVHI